MVAASVNELRMRPSPGKTALIVVDMQNGFCDPKGSMASMGMPIEMLTAAVEPCRRLIAAARAAEVPVIFTRYLMRPDHADGGIMVKYLVPDLAGSGYLVAGEWDGEVVDALAPRPRDWIVDKNRPSSFYATGLEPILNGLEIDSLVVCGVTTNCCVETTVRDASQRDYKTFVVADATGELERQRHDFALDTMGFLFADVVTVDKMAELWSAQAKAA